MDEHNPINAPVIEPLPKRRRLRRRSFHSRISHKLRKSLRRLGASRSVLLVLVGLCAIAAVGMIALVSEAQMRVFTAAETLTRLIDGLEQKPQSAWTFEDFDRLKRSVDDLNLILESAEMQTTLVRPFAVLLPEAQVQFAMLDVARPLVQAGADLLAGAQPVALFISGDADSNTQMMMENTRLVELLNLGQSRFLQAEVNLVEAQSALNKVPLTEISATALTTYAEMQSMSGAMSKLAAALVSAPDAIQQALGLTGEMHYLILLQNNAQPRFSGGAVSAYGLASLQHGRLADLHFDAAVDLPAPPVDELVLGSQPDWWNEALTAGQVEDGESWASDFSTAAEQARLYYASTSNTDAEAVDGVIAIGTNAIEEVLNVIGPVRLTTGLEVEASNFRRMIADFDDAADQQHFLIALFETIVTTVQALDDAGQQAVMSVLFESLQTEQITLYFVEVTPQAVVDNLGWSGLQQASVHTDYLRIGETRLAAVNSVDVARQITYDVALDVSGTASSQISLQYVPVLADTPDTEAVADAEFGGVVQLFVPERAESPKPDIEATGTSLITSTGLRGVVQQFSTTYALPPRLEYTYQMPSAVENLGAYRRYQLLVDKQPGSNNDVLTIHVSLPPQAVVITAYPAIADQFNMGQPVLSFRFPFTTDQFVDVIYSLPHP